MHKYYGDVVGAGVLDSPFPAVFLYYRDVEDAVPYGNIGNLTKYELLPIVNCEFCIIYSLIPNPCSLFPITYYFVTESLYTASGAPGFSCRTNRASVQYQPVAKIGRFFRR